MYGFLYQIAVWMATKGLSFGGLLLKNSRQFTNERRNAPRPAPHKVRYWFHCASVGEYEMAAPLIDRLSADAQADDFLITFFSPSGFKQLSKDAQWAKRIMYLPLDTRSDIRRFYKDYDPEYGIIVRYELWYNLLREGLGRGCSMYLINARFQHRHFILSSLGAPYFGLLRGFKGIFCSDPESVERLAAKGLTNVAFTGDTRYDRMQQVKERAKLLDRMERFKGNRTLLMLGSSHEAEENLLLDVMHDLPDLKMVLAPHHVHEDRIVGIETQFSAFRPKTWSSPFLGDEDKLLIINNIGMLSSLYRYADIALVGGGFTGALHNVIEPLMWGNVVLFGPQFDKFPEAASLVSDGLAFVVKNEADLMASVTYWTEKPERLEQQKAKVLEYVQRRLGASDRIAERLS